MHQERAVAYQLEREEFLRSPIAVDAEAEGRVFVVERGCHRIQVSTES